MHASVEGIVFHKDGVITDVNPPALVMVGYALDEMLGRKTLDFIAPDQVPKVMAVMAAGAETAYESAVHAPRRHAHPGRVHRAHDRARRRAAAHDHRARPARPWRRRARTSTTWRTTTR